jgi:hypothetical protein
MASEECVKDLEDLCRAEPFNLCSQEQSFDSACEHFGELEEYLNIISITTTSPFSAFYAQHMWLFNPDVITTFAFFLIVSLISNLFLYCWLRIYRNEVKMNEFEDQEDNEEGDSGYTPRIRRRLSVFDLNKHESNS